MARTRLRRLTSCVALTLAVATGCATLGALGQILQPVRFSNDRDRPAELRLGGGAGGLGGLGGGLGLPTSATVRLWARVENPNPFGLTLSTIDGSLYLEDARAAEVRFPLGLPLEPRGAETIPLDVSIRFSELPGLGGAASRALRGEDVAYRLEGRFAVDAGALGTPTFGPMTLLRGDVRAFR